MIVRYVHQESTARHPVLSSLQETVLMVTTVHLVRTPVHLMIIGMCVSDSLSTLTMLQAVSPDIPARKLEGRPMVKTTRDIAWEAWLSCGSLIVTVSKMSSRRLRFFQ